MYEHSLPTLRCSSIHNITILFATLLCSWMWKKCQPFNIFASNSMKKLLSSEYRHPRVKTIFDILPLASPYNNSQKQNEVGSVCKPFLLSALHSMHGNFSIDKTKYSAGYRFLLYHCRMENHWCAQKDTITDFAILPSKLNYTGCFEFFDMKLGFNLSLKSM